MCRLHLHTQPLIQPCAVVPLGGLNLAVENVARPSIAFLVATLEGVRLLPPQLVEVRGEPWLAVVESAEVLSLHIRILAQTYVLHDRISQVADVWVSSFKTVIIEILQHGTQFIFRLLIPLTYSAHHWLGCF